MITSLIFGRYWSSDDGDGSSPRAVSRQFLRSSGICASSLFGDEPEEKQVRVSLSQLRFFFSQGAITMVGQKNKSEERGLGKNRSMIVMECILFCCTWYQCQPHGTTG